MTYITLRVGGWFQPVRSNFARLAIYRPRRHLRANLFPGTTLSELCQNCDTPLQGRYCANCGQRRDDLDVSLGTLLTSLLSDIFSLDGRLARTLKPLFLKPGFVPREFVSGRRARHVPPIRLFLLSSAVMFVVLALVGPEVNTTETRASVPDTTAVAETPVDSAEANPSFVQRIGIRLNQNIQRAAADEAAFSRQFLTNIARLMFFLVPVFAAFLKILYRDHLYVHHLVFAVYFHAVAFSIQTVATLLGEFGVTFFDILSALLVFGVAGHLLFAMRRFYDASWLKTSMKFTVLSVAYFIISAISLLLLLGISLLLF